MRVLFQPPAVLRRWGDKDDHRPAGAWELLHDLALVAALIRVSQSVKDAGINALSLGMGTIATSLLFDVQIALTLYTTRFHQPDLVHQGYTFVAITLMVLAAVHLEPFSGEDGEAYFHGALPGFAGSFAAMFALLIFMYSIVAYYALEARVLGLSYIAGYAVSGGLCLVVAVGHQSFGSAGILLMLLVASIVGAYLPMTLSCLPREYLVPIHVAHVAERFALVTLLALGELVVSLVLPDLRFDARHYGFLCLGVFLVFLVFLTYYYGQPFEAKHHAMRRSSCAGRVWVLSQRVNVLGLVGVGIALKSLLSHLPIPGNSGEGEGTGTDDGHRRALASNDGATASGNGSNGGDRAEQWMLCVSLALSLLSMSIARMQHRGVDWELGLGSASEGDSGVMLGNKEQVDRWAQAVVQRRILWACRGVLCAAPVAEVALWRGDGLGLLGLCVVVAVLYVFVDQFDEMRGAGNGAEKGRGPAAFSTAFSFQTWRGSGGPAPSAAARQIQLAAGLRGAGSGTNDAVVTRSAATLETASAGGPGESLRRGPLAAPAPALEHPELKQSVPSSGSGSTRRRLPLAVPAEDEDSDQHGQCVFGSCLETRMECEGRREQQLLEMRAGVPSAGVDAHPDLDHDARAEGSGLVTVPGAKEQRNNEQFSIARDRVHEDTGSRTSVGAAAVIAGSSTGAHGSSAASVTPGGAYNCASIAPQLV